LIDTLLQLADEGFHSPVMELFKIPMQYCPDILVLGLLQSVCVVFFYICALKNSNCFYISLFMLKLLISIQWVRSLFNVVKVHMTNS